MLNFLNTFSPVPVLVDFGMLKIYWYGLLLCLAVFICLFVWVRLDPKNKEHIYNLAFYLIIFGFIGARLWHVLFYNFEYFISHPLKIFYIWNGGLSIWGGITTGLLVLGIYSKKQSI